MSCFTHQQIWFVIIKHIAWYVKNSEVFHSCVAFECVVTNMIQHIFWSCVFARIDPGNKKELWEESRSMTPWQSFHLRYLLFILSRPHVNSHCCFYFWNHFHSNCWFIICKKPIILARLLLNGTLSVWAVWKVRERKREGMCQDDETKGDRTVFCTSEVIITGTICKSSTRQSFFLLYMTECVVIWLLSTSPSTPSLTLTRLFRILSLFCLKYVEKKRKEISPQGGGPPTKSIKSSIKISSLTLWGH